MLKLKRCHKVCKSAAIRNKMNSTYLNLSESTPERSVSFTYMRVSAGAAAGRSAVGGQSRPGSGGGAGGSGAAAAAIGELQRHKSKV